MPPTRPALASLDIADPAARWRSLGFAVAGSALDVGGVRLNVGAQGTGITSWTLRGVDGVSEIDGLPTATAGDENPASPTHPNGAVALDHVVVLTPDFDRTQAALGRAGITLSRIRDAGGVRMGFRRVGPAILELVEAPEAPPGPARFWGLVVIAEDLDALATRLGERLGPVKPAVQPGRHIATLRRSAGLSTPLAFMDPERPLERERICGEGH